MYATVSASYAEYKYYANRFSKYLESVCDDVTEDMEKDMDMDMERKKEWLHTLACKKIRKQSSDLSVSEHTLDSRMLQSVQDLHWVSLTDSMLISCAIAYFAEESCWNTIAFILNNVIYSSPHIFHSDVMIRMIASYLAPYDPVKNLMTTFLHDFTFRIISDIKPTNHTIPTTTIKAI
jgi:hypothetical protein